MSFHCQDTALANGARKRLETLTQAKFSQQFAKYSLYSGVFST